MQQVAAINSDIASPGIHANASSQSNNEGLKDEFAQFLNNSDHSSDPRPEYRGPDSNVQRAKSTESETAPETARETAPETASNKSSTEQSGTVSAEDSNAVEQPVKAEKRETESKINASSDEKTTDVNSGDQQQGKPEDSSSTDDDPHHEQWISIIQQLNGAGEAGKKQADQVKSDSVLADELQSTVATDDKKVPEVVEESEQEVVETVSSLDAWKQELRDKLLSSTGELNLSQRKSMEKKLSELTEDDIKQLLNDDKSLRNMVSSILKTEDPDPQDVALLLQLAEQNNDELYNSVSIEDLIAEQNGEAGQSESEGTDSEQFLDGENGQQTTNPENIEIPEELLNDVLVDEVIPEVKVDGEETPDPLPQPDVNLKTDTHTVDVKPSVETSEKAEPLNIKQLINDLEHNLDSPEDKVLAAENLAKRIENSDAGKTPAGHKFLESLKNTLQEYKSQLKDGHEPAINMNKMMTDAIVAESGQVDALALENQMKQALQQMVSVAQAHQSLDSGARESLLGSLPSGLTASNMTRESNASQLELSKAQQVQSQAQVMDKAVNIMKPEAAQDLANKVQVMMNQKNMVADIRLDPPDLGQMQIKITMQGDTASVNIVVQSQAAREALEHSQPRLKELLDQQGIELGQSSVREEGRQEAGQGERGQLASGGSSTDGEDIEGSEATESYATVNEPEGIDYFA